MLQDNGVKGTGPGGISLSYVYTHRARYLAMNNKGEIAVAEQYSVSDLVAITDAGVKLVAQQNSAAPGGGTYSNFQTVVIDDNTHVAFTGNISDGTYVLF